MSRYLRDPTPPQWISNCPAPPFLYFWKRKTVGKHVRLDLKEIRTSRWGSGKYVITSKITAMFCKIASLSEQTNHLENEFFYPPSKKKLILSTNRNSLCNWMRTHPVIESDFLSMLGQYVKYQHPVHKVPGQELPNEFEVVFVKHYLSNTLHHQLFNTCNTKVYPPFEQSLYVWTKHTVRKVKSIG